MCEVWTVNVRFRAVTSKTHVKLSDCLNVSPFRYFVFWW